MAQDHPISRRELLGVGAGPAAGLLAQRLVGEVPAGSSWGVTQMYFAGEALNDSDRILQALSPADRERVTVALEPAGAGSAAGSRLGRFDITLRPVR